MVRLALLIAEEHRPAAGPNQHHWNANDVQTYYNVYQTKIIVHLHKTSIGENNPNLSTPNQ